MDTTSILSIAQSYVNSGLSVLPIRSDGSKAPKLKAWAEYQQRRPTEEELQKWFGNGSGPGIGVIGGAVSGNLEVLDFEGGSPWIEFGEALEAMGQLELRNRLTIVSTPGDGIHFFYRCPEIAGSQKLLMAGGKTSVETRGEKAYVVTAGSPPGCHPTGKLYRLMHGDLTKIQTITPEERGLLFDIVRSLGEPAPVKIITGYDAGTTGDGQRPGDEFNRRTTWKEVIEPHGYTFLGTSKDGESFWARPGKVKGIGATTNYKNSDLLYILSTNASLQHLHSYDRFGAYAELNFGKDNFSEAAAHLKQLGYGKTEDPEIKEFRAQAEAAGPIPTTADEWPDPEDLQPALPPVMKLDPRLMPPIMAAYVADEAERKQCPPDFVAGAVLGALAAAVGRRVQVQPKSLDTGWKHPCNLWICLVGRPSTMKSPAVEGAIRILSEIERVWTDEHTVKAEAYEIEKEKDVIYIAAWKEQAKAAAKKGNHIADKPIPTVDEKAPVGKRLILGDASYEALHLRLSENPYGLLLYRDELSSLFASLEEEGRRAERGFLLECYNGNFQLKFDRIGRGTIDCPNACLSILGTIQPGRLYPVLSGAINQGKNDDGLSQRFLYLWPDPLENFEYINRPVDLEAEGQLAQVLRTLANWMPEEIPVFRLCEEAQGIFEEWYTQLIRDVKRDDIHPAVEAFQVKLPKPVTAIALLLELFERASSGRPLDDPPVISYENMCRAAGWSEYLLSHSKRAYYHLTREQIVSASLLGERILSGDVGSDGEFTAREVYRKCWAMLSDPEKVTAACKELIAANWIFPVITPLSKTRGRVSEKYRINPKVLSKVKGVSTL